MLKNAIISFLLSCLLAQSEAYAAVSTPATVIAVTTIIFCTLTAVEEEIERFKNKKYYQKRLERYLERINERFAEGRNTDEV